MTQMTLAPVHGRTTSGGAPVLFEAPLPAGCCGVYSTGGKVYFYGGKYAPKGDLTQAATISSDMAEMKAAIAALTAALAAKK